MLDSTLLEGTPEALAVKFATGRYDSMWKVRRLLTDSPKSETVIVSQSGMVVTRVRGALSRLCDAGLAMRHPNGGYVARGPLVAEGDGPLVVGRCILSCLTEPRRARDIAEIIQRPPSVTTGHLRHLLNRGLIVRVGKGVYALTSRVGSEKAEAEPVAQPKTSRRRTARVKAKERMKALARKLAKIEGEYANRIGKIAIRAGLIALDLTDAALLAEFKAMAARFQEERPC